MLVGASLGGLASLIVAADSPSKVAGLVLVEGAAEFLEFVPHAQFVNVLEADHRVAGDANDAFNDAVFAFLARHVPATAGV